MNNKGIVSVVLAGSVPLLTVCAVLIGIGHSHYVKGEWGKNGSKAVHSEYFTCDVTGSKACDLKGL